MALPLHVPPDKLEGRTVTASQLRPRRPECLPASHLGRARAMSCVEIVMHSSGSAALALLHCTFTRVMSCIAQ